MKIDGDAPIADACLVELGAICPNTYLPVITPAWARTSALHKSHCRFRVFPRQDRLAPAVGGLRLAWRVVGGLRRHALDGVPQGVLLGHLAAHHLHELRTRWQGVVLLLNQAPRFARLERMQAAVAHRDADEHHRGKQPLRRKATERGERGGDEAATLNVAVASTDSAEALSRARTIKLLETMSENNPPEHFDYLCNGHAETKSWADFM